MNEHLAALIRLIARAVVADLTAEESQADPEPTTDEPETDSPAPPRHSPT